MNDTTSISRREFLGRCARGGIAAALGLMFGKMLLGNKIALPGSDDCIGNTICARCTIARDCGLPQALSYRESKPGARQS